MKMLRLYDRFGGLMLRRGTIASDAMVDRSPSFIQIIDENGSANIWWRVA
ncbi:MAG: hypothetical protein ACO31I_19745 [Prochlorotrichaceae cyanobacterium]|jgi:hypothetical protein